MKNQTLHLPAKFSALSQEELADIAGGAAAQNAWDVAVGVVTGLASAGADAFAAVMRGELDPLSALCKGAVSLAGIVVAEIIWLIF